MSARPTGNAAARVAVVSLALAAAACRDDRVAQPLAFNHQVHAVTNQMGCDTCHEHVFDRPFAGLPKVALCMGCHEAIDVRPAAAAQLAILRQHAREGSEIRWARLYELPHNVYYSHRRHTKIAGLDCPTCHGDIGRSETPPEYPIERTLTMRNCIVCHRERGVSDDCAWCHR